MRFSEAFGRKIVSTSTADTVGRVSDFVVDPASRSIVALEVKKADHGESLRWSDITAFGVDAVTVTGAAVITETTSDVAALAGKNRHLGGRRVLSAAGDELGGVDDVDFDPSSGAVLTLIVHDQEVAGERLIGIGSYAVVVATE